MKTLLMILFFGFIYGCEFEALDKLERLANSNFCPGAQREENGECPTPSIRAGWNFEDSSDFTFDKNKVQFSNGSAKLASIDFLKSESDFLEGSHYGTHYDEASKTLALKSKLHSDLDLRNILSDKTQFLEGYWRFENSPNDSSSNNLSSVDLG
ncbi:MAG: hypothetical protein KC478_11890, partial [Bacteriovoracaceae bacterium]|nr:hypothetical protein [Bacteriovoracaceae bacterium]